MRSGSALTAAGVAAFLAFLAAGLPARLLGRWLPPDLRASGWSGTIWSGNVAAIAYRDQPFGSAGWRCRPWRLLAGEWSCSLALQPPGGRIDGEAAARLGGSLALQDMTGRIPLTLLATAAAPGWSGSLEIEGVALEIRDQWPVALRGHVLLRGLTAPAGSAGALGDFELVAADRPAAAGELHARIRDLGGPLWLRATLRVAPDRSWRLEGELAPAAGASPALQDDLAWLGPADRAGRRSLRLEGRL